MALRSKVCNLWLYRVVTEREDIRAVGSGERVDVSFGLRSVQGELVVKSANLRSRHASCRAKQLSTGRQSEEGPG
jgi:hypothetical protein